MTIEKVSLVVLDEMREVIGRNRISREAFLSAIARGMHVVIEEDRKSRPHLFVGPFDRDCELCGNPDRDEIHVFSRERLERAIAEEREACAKVAGDYESTHWHGAEKVAASEIAHKIRARSKGEKR